MESEENGLCCYVQLFLCNGFNFKGTVFLMSNLDSVENIENSDFVSYQFTESGVSFWGHRFYRKCRKYRKIQILCLVSSQNLGSLLEGIDFIENVENIESSDFVSCQCSESGVCFRGHRIYRKYRKFWFCVLPVLWIWCLFLRA